MRILGRSTTGKPLRFAVVAPHYPEYTLRYAQAMEAHHEVLACVDSGQLATEFEGRPADAGRPQNLKSVRFKTPSDLLRLLFAVARFRPAILQFQEAVGPRRGFFVACLATLMKPFALIVLTVHDPTPHEGRDAAAARRAAWTSGYLRRLADVIVVHGPSCARVYREQVGLRQQTLIETTHGLLLEPTSIRLAPAGPLGLYVFGRMEAYKGLGVLLSMAETLHAEGVSFTLSIEGRGPELDRLQDRFLQLPEVQIFNGFVPPLQIMSSIQRAECILLPYLSATQSGVLAAAFAGRRYVIASDIGGLSNVVEHTRNGLLVPPGDVQALIGAVKRLAADPGLRAHLQNGAQTTADTTLNWRRIVDEVNPRLISALQRRCGR